MYGLENKYIIYDSSIPMQYFCALHGAILLMTGNDVGPRTSLQVYLGAFGLFTGAMINANIFGELAVLITSVSSKTNSFQQKMTQVNTMISQLKLPKELGDKIRDFVNAN